MEDIICCGLHEVCEKTTPLTTAEYYDDEELDTYRGKPSEAYTDEEAEEFRYVMLTMRPDEVAGWLRSLQTRGVELPCQLRDEAIMIMGD